MNDKTHQYKGAIDCVRQIMVNEGPFGFFKGFGMCWARVSLLLALDRSCADRLVQLGTHTVLTFLIFERVRYLFGIEAM